MYEWLLHFLAVERLLTIMSVWSAIIRLDNSNQIYIMSVGSCRMAPSLSALLFIFLIFLLVCSYLSFWLGLMSVFIGFLNVGLILEGVGFCKRLGGSV